MLTRGYWPNMFTRGYWPGGLVGPILPSTLTEYEAYAARVSAAPYESTISADYKARVDAERNQ